MLSGSADRIGSLISDKFCPTELKAGRNDVQFVPVLFSEVNSGRLGNPAGICLSRPYLFAVPANSSTHPAASSNPFSPPARLAIARHRSPTSGALSRARA
jgi:hypothetical protein